MNKTRTWLALGAGCLIISACMTVYGTPMISSLQVLRSLPETDSSPLDAAGEDLCAGGCNGNAYVCNPVAHRCVGNESPSVNLCRWQGIPGTALPCGKDSPTISIVDACHDTENCGNCGVACSSGQECFWGACE